MGKIIIGISGEIASGKDTVANYLANRYGAKIFSFSDPLRNVLRHLHLPQTRENLTLVSGALRSTFGDSILSRSVASNAANDESSFVVIDGVRRRTDIKAVSGLPEFSLVYVEADIRVRYDRIVKRRQNADDGTKTFEDFQKDHRLETEIGIPALKADADFVIENDGTLEELYSRVDTVVGELQTESEKRA